jgi:hypothetical protein
MMMNVHDVTLKAKEEGRVGYFSIVWDRWFVPYILGGLENVSYRYVGGTTKGVSVYLGYSPYFDRVGHLKMPMYYEMTINPNPYDGGTRSHLAVWEKKVPCPEVERIMRRTEGEETTTTEKVGELTGMVWKGLREKVGELTAIGTESGTLSSGSSQCHSVPKRYVGAPKWAQQKVRDWDPLDRSIAWPQGDD